MLSRRGSRRLPSKRRGIDRLRLRQSSRLSKIGSSRRDLSKSS